MQITFHQTQLHLEVHKKYSISAIISKVKHTLSRSPPMGDNIVKQTCKELGITQKELAERLEVPQPTVSRWATSEEIPRMAQKYLELMVETKDLNDKFKILKEAHKILSE